MIRYEKMAVPAIMAESDSFRVLERVASPVIPVRDREHEKPEPELVGAGSKPAPTEKAAGKSR